MADKLNVVMTPGGSLSSEMKAVPLKRTPTGRRRRVQSPRPSTSSNVSQSPQPKTVRRGLFLSNLEISKHLLVADSGSEDDLAGDEDENDYADFRQMRVNSRRVRDAVLEQGVKIDDESIDRMLGDENVDANVETKVEMDVEERVEEGLEQPTSSQENADLTAFSWSEDYSSFSGQEETYSRTPGATLASQDPLDIFVAIWDERIMAEIVRETNKYAWQIIAALSETEDGIPSVLDGWFETSVEEMYRYFAVLIFMSLTYNAVIKDYWSTGLMGMPEFRKIMSRNRFELISRFLHFNDNYLLDPTIPSYEKKIYKIKPIIDHCNKKFAELYIPNKQLSLDESLLLWKGRLSWVQAIRTKAARFGIKSFELCEAQTGYLLRCLIYGGKESSMIQESIHGFSNCTAKVVLKLMDGYLDVGHTLVMDDWYNQLLLTRYLKKRRTDLIGTINARRIHIPHAIKYANEQNLLKGDQVARHCGDISLVAWNDVKLVTVVSSYHSNIMVPGRRAGQVIAKPSAIADYNKYMGGVDRKDQMLSMFQMERKRGRKWYIKVFKRLINTSLLNAYLIYKKHPTTKLLTHREFRTKVASRLLEQFPVPKRVSSNKSKNVPVFNGKEIDRIRLTPGNHFPRRTTKGDKKLIQKRCVRCTAAGRRTMVTVMCNLCNEALCIDKCWEEFHTMKYLHSVE